MFLLMVGGCSATQPKAVPIDCVPIVEIVEKVTPIPAELMDIHYNPQVPEYGDNVDLLNWAQACALNSRTYENQMLRLREIQ